MRTHDQYSDLRAPLPDRLEQIERRGVRLNIADDDELQRRLGLDRGQHRRHIPPDTDLRPMLTEQSLQRCVQVAIIRRYKNPRVGWGRNHLACVVESYTLPFAEKGTRAARWAGPVRPHGVQRSWHSTCDGQTGTASMAERPGTLAPDRRGGHTRARYLVFLDRSAAAVTALHQV